MKQGIHPSATPLYTGQCRIVDAEGRVQRFLRKYGMEA